TLESKVDEYLPKIVTMSEKLTTDLTEKFKGITTTAETEIKTCIDGVTNTLKTERDAFKKSHEEAVKAVDEQSKNMKTSIETIKAAAEEKAGTLLKNLTADIDKA